MSDTDIDPEVAALYEQRYQFFSDRGVSLAYELDRVLITLFTGIVAGLLAVLLYHEVAFWSGLFLTLSAVAAVVGLGACLLHLTFIAKVMAGFAAFFGGQSDVPSLIAGCEPTSHAIIKNRALANVCYASQLVCLLWSVSLAGFAITSLVFHVIGWIGVLIVLLGFGTMVALTLRPMLWVYRSSRRVLQQYAEDQREIS